MLNEYYYYAVWVLLKGVESRQKPLWWRLKDRQIITKNASHSFDVVLFEHHSDGRTLILVHDIVLTIFLFLCQQFAVRHTPHLMTTPVLIPSLTPPLLMEAPPPFRAQTTNSHLTSPQAIRCMIYRHLPSPSPLAYPCPTASIRTHSSTAMYSQPQRITIQG